MARTPVTASPRAEVRLRMPYDEYLRTVDESAHAEWVDGEVTIFMPPGLRHQRISRFLLGLLDALLVITGRGEVLGAPFEMKLRAGRSYREPDVLVVLAHRAHQLTAQRLEGPADIAFELLSPESLDRDRQEKLAEYAAAGIPEYWIVDATDEQRGIDAYGLADSGAYEPIAPDADGHIRSRVLPEFWLDPAWFVADDLPATHEALRALLPDAAL